MPIIKTAGRYSILSATSLFKLIIRHWQIFIFIFVIAPSIYSSIHTAVTTDNPLIPAIDLAKRIFVGDAQIKEDLASYQANPTEFVGMEKPTIGIWFTIKYWWLFFWHVIYRFFGNLYLIFVPFFVIRKLVFWKNTSAVWKSYFIATILFLFYLFFINVIFVVSGVTEVILPEGLTDYQRIWQTFLQMLPFSGVISLIKYIFTFR